MAYSDLSSNSRPISRLWEDERFCLSLIFFIAFLLRLIVAIKLSAITGDLSYDILATNMLRYHKYTFINVGSFVLPPTRFTSLRAPAYPFFLALVYRLFGRSYLSVGIFQSLVGASTCLLTYFIGKKLFSKRVGFLASLIIACYPYMIYHDTRIIETSLFALLTAGGILCLLKIPESPSLYNQIATGILLGLAALCRPTILAFVPFGILWIFIYLGGKNWKKVTKIAGVIVLFLILTILPWTIRNYFVQGRIVSIATNGGYNFLLGNNRLTERVMRQMSSLENIGGMGLITGEEYRYLSNLSEAERDRWFFQKGVEFINKNPATFLKLAGMKFIKLWSWNIYPGTDRLKRLTYSISYAPLLILSLLGMILSTIFADAKFKRILLLYFLFISFTLMYMLFWASTRFRIPLDIYLAMFASYSLLFLGDSIRARLKTI